LTGCSARKQRGERAYSEKSHTRRKVHHCSFNSSGFPPFH
jgi:hypothetical protein